MTTRELRELYAYHRWATARVLACAERLSGGQLTQPLVSSFGSVRDTLLHVLWADWVWLRRWTGLSPRITLDRDEFPDVPALRARWREVHDEAEDFLAAVADGEASRPVAYRNTRGEPFETPLDVLVRHVVNHGSYHRGQVITMCRQLGLTELPATDLIAYWRETGRG